MAITLHIHHSIEELLIYKTTITFLLGDFDEKNKVFSSKYYAYCRDLVVENYREFYRKWKGKATEANTTFKLNPFDRTRFIYFNSGSSADRVAKIDKRVELLNQFERKLHWKRTKVEEVDRTLEVECRHDTIKKRKINKNGVIYMITGSKCWAQNPFFLYIYLSFFKLPIAKSLEEMLKNAHKKKNGHGFEQYDKAYTWMNLLNDRRKWFKGFTFDSLYNYHEGGYPYNYCYGVGPYAFILRNTSLKHFIGKDGTTLFSRAEEFHKEVIKK